MTRLRRGQSYIEVIRDSSVRTAAVEEWVLRAVGPATPSVQLAIQRNGELAVSMAAGLREGHVTRESLHLLYSSTKLYSTLVMLLLHDRGLFEWDDPVAKYWAEFGQAGKDQVTIRHVISHRAGMAAEPAGTTWGWWGDRETIGREMARMGLKWEPGSAQAYHNRTWGFILDNLVWRLTGKGIDGVLRDEVLDPLGIEDFYLGLPEELYRTRFVKTETAAVERLPDGPRDEFRPFIGGELNLFNALEVVRLPLAWGTVTATAEAAAEVASFFALGGVHRALRVFSEQTLDEALQHPGGEDEGDPTSGGPARWGLGIQLHALGQVGGLEDAFGHGGGTTVHVWAHRGSRISVACVLGGLRPDRARVFGGPRPADWHRSLAAAIAADLLG